MIIKEPDHKLLSIKLLYDEDNSCPSCKKSNLKTGKLRDKNSKSTKNNNIIFTINKFSFFLYVPNLLLRSSFTNFNKNYFF